MPPQESPRNPIPTLWVWRLFFTLGALQSGLAAWLIARIPSEEGSRLILGLSPSRLVLAAIFMGLLGGFGWLSLGAWRDPEWFQRMRRRITQALSRPGLWGTLILVSLLGLLGGGYLATLTPDISEPFTRSILTRLQPLAIWLAGISAFTLIAAPLLRPEYDLSGFKPQSRIFYLLAALVGLLFVGWSWVTRTQLETESLVTGWYSQSTPLLATQVLLAWVLGFIALGVIFFKQSPPAGRGWLNRLKPGRFDLAVILALWLGTILLWGSIPIDPTWFISEKRPPNFEYYPNSDALSYDMSAQGLLVGEGLRFVGTPFVRRPMHAIFLTALHAIGGQDYPTVVWLQIIVLATLPALIYLVGKSLHNRASGVIAGVLIALRESNAIALAETITSSHAKTLLADLPATLAVVGFVTLALLWLKRPRENRLIALAAGGALGIATLIRPELGALLFGLGLMSFLILRHPFSRWIKGFSLFLLGVVLVLSPWVWRNWKVTGLIFLDSPSFRFELLDERYQEIQFTPTPTPSPSAVTEGSTQASPTQTVQPAPSLTPASEISPTIKETPIPRESIPYLGYVSGTIREVLQFTRENSAQVASFIASHYLNSQMQILMIMPTSVRIDSLIGFLGRRDPQLLWAECCSRLDYVRRLPYWHKWDGVFPSQAAVPLIVNSFIMILGIYEAWKRYKWIGLTPLALSVVHLAVNAVFRNSGGRYILPVDWVGVIYFGFGLVRLTFWALGLFTRRDLSPLLEFPQDEPLVQQGDQATRNLLTRPRFYLLALGLFLVGWAPPILEFTIKPLYSESVRVHMLETLLESDIIQGDQRASLETFLDQGGVTISGRALYPRFFPAGQGEPGSVNPMGPMPYPRVGFYLAGEGNLPVILPSDEKPNYFPNGAPTLVFGCPERGVDPWAVAVFKSDGSPVEFIRRTPNPASSSCPLPTMEQETDHE